MNKNSSVFATWTKPVGEFLTLTSDKKFRFSAKYFGWPVCNIRLVSENNVDTYYLVSISLLTLDRTSNMNGVNMVVLFKIIYNMKAIGMLDMSVPRTH